MTDRQAYTATGIWDDSGRTQYVKFFVAKDDMMAKTIIAATVDDGGGQSVIFHGHHEPVDLRSVTPETSDQFVLGIYALVAKNHAYILNSDVPQILPREFLKTQDTLNAYVRWYEDTIGHTARVILGLVSETIMSTSELLDILENRSDVNVNPENLTDKMKDLFLLGYTTNHSSDMYAITDKGRQFIQPKGVK